MSGREVAVAGNGAVATQQDAPQSLVQLAIEKGVDVEVIERLVALQERVTERNARAAFVEALSAFREECPPIQKTRINDQFSVTRNGVRRQARYAPLEEIDRVARPVAAKYGLTWTWDTRIEGDLMNVVCRVMHIAGHAESTSVAMPFASKAGSSPQQKYGSAQTYGMRYSLIAALGLTMADEDDDGAGGNAGGGDEHGLTDDQLANLSALIDEVKADRPRFLRYMGVEKLEDIPSDHYAQAVSALEAKRAS